MSILAPQIEFEPKVVGEVKGARRVVLGGMGGSALPGRVLCGLYPGRVSLHLDYDLPQAPPEDALYIAVSYSGNTEETLSFFEAARARGYRLAVVASGGILLDNAKECGVPYVVVPKRGEPRDQFIILIKSILALMRERGSAWDAYPHVEQDVETRALALLKEISGKTPIIYSSTRNEPLAYIAKITLNETGKTPAFLNVFPEMNHNELQGLEHLSSQFVPVLLCDMEDDPRVSHRMDVFEEVMRAQGSSVVRVEVPKGTRIHTILYAWLLFRKVGHLVALEKGVVADETPLIAQFKKLL